MTNHPSPETRQALTQHDMIDPACGNPSLLTRSPVRSLASAADLAPQPPRPGSQQGLASPSRIGSRLHHRDGRVTDLHGTSFASNSSESTP